MKKIYLDHAATTPVDPAVVEAMLPYFSERYGNPSSLHASGQEARTAVTEARKTMAECLGAKPEEIIFTSGGSEADNMAIKGVATALADRGDHIVTSPVEHPAVLETVRFLEKNGFTATYVPVDHYGRISPDDVRVAITPKTVLVSIMHANNEVGTIQPIAEIAAVCRERNVYLHTDAVQTFGAIPFTVDSLGVQLLSLSAHKFYGPKGVGLLYVRKGTRISPLIHGGGQESNRRASTHNVPGIVGMACAARLARESLAVHAEHDRLLRNRLIQGILRRIDDVMLNGHPEERLPNNCHVIIRFIEGEALLLRLNELGVEGATGSACSSGSLEPSHVLLAMGISPADAHGSLRLTVGKNTLEADVDAALELLPRVVADLRSISPLHR